ncbi:hypothetical protein Tco_1246281 [Tanacetum coccineum]
MTGQNNVHRNEVKKETGNGDLGSEGEGVEGGKVGVLVEMEVYAGELLPFCTTSVAVFIHVVSATVKCTKLQEIERELVEKLKSWLGHLTRGGSESDLSWSDATKGRKLKESKRMETKLDWVMEHVDGFASCQYLGEGEKSIKTLTTWRMISMLRLYFL